MGIRHFCVGWDVMVLSDWFTEQGKAMREVLAEASNGSVPAERTPAAAVTNTY